MTGTLINVGTIITGTFIGMVVKARMPERITQTTMDGIGLFTIFVGLSMLLENACSSMEFLPNFYRLTKFLSKMRGKP